MKIGYIGSGRISKFHLPAIRNNNLTIKGIGTRKNSINCKTFAKDSDLLEYYCKGGWNEVLDKNLDAYCICVDTDVTADILLKVLDKGKPILVEKPVAWNLLEIDSLCKHKNSNNIFVAYNRRFYDVVKQAKDFCDKSDSGTVNINIPDSKQGRKVFLSNGCHMIDLARYLLGDFEVLNKVIRYDSISGEIASLTALCSNKKWSISINAHSLIPSNFGITINSKKNVFELLPIEKFNLYQGLEIIEPDSNNPLRRYVPKIIKTGYEISKFKPGFDNMYKDFREFIRSDCKPSKKNNTIFEARNTLLKCIELIEDNQNKLIR